MRAPACSAPSTSCSATWTSCSQAPESICRFPPSRNFSIRARGREGRATICDLARIGRRRRPRTPPPLPTTSALFFSRPTDPGDWDLSPEWYGSQGGGYGRDDGAVVYESGDVVVTSHAASPAAPGGDGDDEWRVLRFGGATRQSVCRVGRASDGGEGRPTLRMDPTCLAFEYTKTLVALSLALLPLPAGRGAGADDAGAGAGDDGGRGVRPRILCVGVGGGSVPAALAALRPDADVSAHELDPRVVGAWPATGLSGVAGDAGAGDGEGEGPRRRLENLSLHQGCGADAVAAVARSRPASVDLLIVDAFDARDRVPSVFTDDELAPSSSPSSPSSSSFFRDVAEALSPRGSVLINLHCGPRPGPAAALSALFPFGDGASPATPSSSAFDASRGEGKEAVDVARTYAKNVLGRSDARSAAAGVAFMVAARRQQNAVGVASRGGLLALGQRGRGGFDAAALAAAASAGASACALPLPFDVGSRANFGLLKL